ncbi:solute carrier family 23 protein [Falsiroseomonas stagni]|uniref:Nucleobase:cation symporter-2, NCS2 family n=1 Tax=Falsiroseomonas stagni DSM 19981 TaxID=1123062 RepID=A0A1I4AEG9_9PROT|nr:solute carrier family 23 protein [Falsiroseomonas stagni]SFK54580.1 nucleobase:cation symporter-2, NCS2 family [Falsiroseomonas stagni DSM 19981]
MTTGSRPSWTLASAPPASVIWPAALQHVGLGAVTLVFPRVVAEAAGADDATLTNYIALAMIALGVSTLLQAWGQRGIGSGFLLPAVFTAVYLPPSLVAAQMGGLGAVAGLTLAAGITQVGLSFLVQRLRPYLPTELAGLVVLMIGLVLGLLGLRLMTGFGPGARNPAHDLVAPAITILVIIVLTVWGGARWRPVAVLAGLGAGVVAHLLDIALVQHHVPDVAQAVQWPHWPIAMPSLPLALLPGVLVGALACLVRASGDIVACQRANDPGWKRPDFGSIRAGVLADGLGTVMAGVIGVPGTNTYTASVGLAIASGVMARRVAIAVGVLWITLGLVPGAPALVLAVPRGVLGAALFFAAAFIVVTGMGIVVQRALDARRSLVVGAAFVVGVSYDATPQLFVSLPDSARMLLTSSLVLGLIVGLVLNAAFRAGATRQREAVWRPTEGHEAMEDFATDAGSAWGARAEVVARLRGAMEEAAGLLTRQADPGTVVALTGRFDEFNLDVTLRWHGRSLREDAAPLLSAEADGEEVATRLAALLLWHAADRVAESRLPDGRRELRLHYDH